MRIIFKDGQILDLNSVEKIIIEPTDGEALSILSNIEFSGGTSFKELMNQILKDYLINVFQKGE